ncbi:hypothetical protein FRB99_000991 [Tulasnella sp. 403]|nr:hypothetical protein FRB99_000991 [Tulasnella sp. 403]
MADTTTKDAATTEPRQEKTIESEVELAKRAFALRKFEQAVDHYATALELMTAKYGDGAIESADLLFLYGKALLENAIAQADVIKKEEADGVLKGDKDDGAASGSKVKGKVIEFSGDGEEEEDPAVDLLGGAAAAEDEGGDAEEGEEEEEEEGGDEPEDDFNAAWEVLDLARSLYAKMTSEEDKLKLSDTYIALGDVSLETEKFDQAVNDYTAGLNLKTKILPFHSRQIAEAHYRLSLVLDLTPGKLSAAIEHAEKAVQSVEARLQLLRSALDNASAQATSAPAPPTSSKGKEKATNLLSADSLAANDSLEGLTKAQIEAQIKEFEGLKNDLDAKVEDLKTVPDEQAAPITSATAAANQALDEALNPGFSLAGSSTQVNDLPSDFGYQRKDHREAESRG